MAGPDLPTQNPIDKYFVKVTRYHYYFFTLYLLSKFTTVWHTLNIVFISPPMNYTCADSSTGENVLNKCPCDKPVWDTSMFTKTVQTTYNIICSDKYLISISESGTFFGVLWGSMLFGLLSDKIGRLTSLCLSCLFMGVSGCLIAIMPNIYLFIIVRILEGFGVGGVIGTGYVLCMEYCGPSYRPIMASVVHIPTNFGVVLMAGISYLIRDYHYFQLVISTPLLFFALMKFCLLDSPKWMLNNNKEKTLQLMKKFCRLYGRLNTFSGSMFIMGVTGCLAAIMPNIFLFIIVRIFEGAGVGGTLVTGFVLTMEYCGPKYRAIISSLIHIPANLGLVILAGISYILRDYRMFQLAVSIPLFLLSTIKFCTLESPKWLLDHNKEKTIKVMEKFCRFNKNPCETLRAEIESYHGSQMNLNGGVKLKFYHIFKYKRHTRNFLCMAYCFFVCGMCYYGVAQFIGKMSRQVHANTAFNGLFCCIGTCFSIVTINRFSRKRYLGGCMTVAGVCMFVVVSMPPRLTHSFVSVLFACLSSCSFYVAFIITYLYGVELFPTSIRNSVFGMLSLSSRIGQIMGPQINGLSSTVAGIVFGIAAIIAAGLTFLLPETKGIELPSSLEDDPSVSPNQTSPEVTSTKK